MMVRSPVPTEVAAMRRRWFALLLLAPFAAASLAAGEPSPAREVVVERDVVYGKGGGQDLQLDIAYPKGRGPFPAVVGIHGGAWRRGSRKHLNIPLPCADKRSIIDYFAYRGFVAVTVSYRLAPASKYPAMIEDCKAAVRWLRANAGKYHVDPDH